MGLACETSKETRVLMPVKKSVTKTLSTVNWLALAILLWKAAGIGTHCLPTIFLEG